jgi:hypothetical protein
VVTAVLGTAAPADAAWGGTGTGSAAGRAVVMPAGQKPTASVTGSDVTLRWSAAVLPGGTPVAGYRLTRYDGNGNPVTVLAACSGTVASTTCTEHNVPSGTWTYTDTPAQDSWSGAPSPPSAAVVVAATG